jgi:hypothetical protein
MTVFYTRNNRHRLPASGIPRGEELVLRKKRTYRALLIALLVALLVTLFVLALLAAPAGAQNNGGETIGGDTNGDNNKQRNQRQRRVVRNNIIINNESSTSEGEDDEIDEITETKDEADILNDEADALDNSTPADADEQAPVHRPQGDVVNEVPTSGPLPNTGGVPVATGTVLAVVLFGAGLLSIRIVMLWRKRTRGG